jgi:amidophosphoribosyltransferase
MPSVQELIGNGRTEPEIAAAIGADQLIYQDLSDLVEAAREGNPDIQNFDSSCFDGRYITGDVNKDYLDRIEQARCDTIKTGRSMAQSGNDHVSAEVLTFPR